MSVFVAATFSGGRPGNFQTFTRRQLGPIAAKGPSISLCTCSNTQLHSTDVCYLSFCAFFSHLLEEDLEPFEVLPKGRIGPSLVMALRVLFASEEEFSRWYNLEGRLSFSTKLQLFRPVCLSVWTVASDLWVALLKDI